MPYSSDVDNGNERRWEIQFTHNATGVRIGCSVLLGAGTESQKDTVFQALLDKIVTLSGVTVNSAKKYTLYESTITQTP
jgi:hypothetical protein